MSLDIGLDPDGDLDWVDGDFVLVQGLACQVQELTIRWKRLLGEWFEDTDVGMPLFETILVKNPNRVEIEARFRLEAAKVPGFSRFESFTLTVNPDRTASITARVWFDTGPADLSLVVEIP